VKLPIFSIALLSVVLSSCVKTTSDINNSEIASHPKLVVGIVVDQMRYDYLTRFYHRFGEGGFKRMMSEGFNCKNNHFN
jgi:flagellar biosynthesis protein FliQ